MKTKKRKFAVHVFRALSTTEEEDITCGQKRHTRNSVKPHYLSGCSLCMQRTDAASWVATNVNTSHLSGGQCPVFRALSNTEAEDIICMQRKQCQLLARHLDGRIFHSNALKGVVIRATDFMRAESVDGCNEHSTMHSLHPEKHVIYSFAVRKDIVGVATKCHPLLCNQKRHARRK